MRWMLLLLAVVSGGVAYYEGTFARNSFSTYSNDQLDTLEREYSVESRGAFQSTNEADISTTLLADERRRRVLFPSAIGAAVLFVVGAALVPARRRRRAATESDDGESERLKAALGDPALALAGARKKAAELLGVSVNAPPEVVEAALQAQLKTRDVSRLDGVAPDLKQMALEQRAALVKARDLLLKKDVV